MLTNYNKSKLIKVRHNVYKNTVTLKVIGALLLFQPLSKIISKLFNHLLQNIRCPRTFQNQSLQILPCSGRISVSWSFLSNVVLFALYVWYIFFRIRVLLSAGFQYTILPKLLKVSKKHILPLSLLFAKLTLAMFL